VVVPVCVFVTSRSAFSMGVLAVGPAVAAVLVESMDRALVAVVPAAPVAVTLTVMVIVSAPVIAGAVQTYVGVVTTHETGPGEMLKTPLTTPALAFVSVPETATEVSSVPLLVATTV
jgi:hypothetical protein